MIKGCAKRVVVVREMDSKLFEEAYFIVKSGVKSRKYAQEDYIGEAGRIVKTQLYPYEKNVKLEITPEESSSAQAYSSAFPQSRQSVRRKKKAPRARDAAIFAFGAAISALFCTVIYYSGIFL